MNHRHLMMACFASAAALHVTSGHAAECEQLSSLKLAHTEITLAQTVAAGAFQTSRRFVRRSWHATPGILAATALLPRGRHAPANR
jgi:hypothetical protein